ncbi:hypothetical protein MJD09_14435 [bacterium]|nr:hypothetical protein [bacterium]
MSLLKELQQVTERTYKQHSGINLEKFVIGKERFRDLSVQTGEQTQELSEIARVFFRINQGRLFLALYFSEWLITALEKNDPRKGLTERNILAFMVFIEEVNHGVHTALKFLSGDHAIEREDFIRDLELLAKIDTYQVLKFFMAYFNASRQLERYDRLWLRHHLFERGNFVYRNPVLSHRYQETNWLGEKYTRFLDNISKDHRISEIRRFREMSYPIKASYIRMLP